MAIIDCGKVHALPHPHNVSISNVAAICGYALPSTIRGYILPLHVSLSFDQSEVRNTTRDRSHGSPHNHGDA